MNTIIKINNRQATFLAAIAFLLTLALSYYLPGYTITLSGLLVVIFLSVFVKNIRSTLIASGICLVVIVAFFALQKDYTTAKVVVEYLFVVFLVLFTTLLVLTMKRLNQNMLFEKTHMSALFENATEGIVLTNQLGEMILANPAALKMFGYDEKEMIGFPVEILLPQTVRHNHVKLRETFYGEPQHRVMGWGRDLYAQKKTGVKFPVEVSLSYYFKGQQRYVIAFIVDITHRKLIEESMRLQQQELEKVTDELRNLNAELEMKVEERTLILKEALQKLEESQRELSEALDKERQLNEIKSRFVSMASHEFRTPLSTVLSSASLLSKYTGSSQQDKRDKHIARIKDAVKNLNDILEDFLSLGKLDEGKVSTAPVAFALNEFIEETIDELKGLLKSEQQIVYNHNSDILIYTDKKLLKNILLNLVSNAVKFSPASGKITVASELNGDFASISVKDQGIGISTEDQQHLFSSFFRGRNAINIQGTGLGLHIVKRYLDLLQGTAELTSELLKGTEITVKIPINLSNGKDNISN